MSSARKPPNAGKGRVKGVPNKLTKELKAMILGALDDAGGQAYLAQQAQDNPAAFMTLVGKVLPLTRSEFRLLDTLIRQPGRVFHRAELIDAALGEDTMVMERTIDVHIRALRRKLGDAADVIETVRGVGYRFRDTELAELPA